MPAKTLMCLGRQFLEANTSMPYPAMALSFSRVHLVVSFCQTFVWCIALYQSILHVLQLLQTLSENLAIAVLAAAPADLKHKLVILPASLHPLAIEAALPSIRPDHCITLDFNSPHGSDHNTAYALLNAASTGKHALRKLDLQNIPVPTHESLLQLIAAACKSAGDVSLSFGYDDLQHEIERPPFTELQEALSHNSALTSLQLKFCAVVEEILPLTTLPALKTLQLTLRRKLWELP
jgi:hypothetical protein